MSAMELDEDEMACYSVVVKRVPVRLPARVNDVYVSRNAPFQGQVQRIKKLLDNGYGELFVHAMGAAIPRAVKLALHVEKMYGGTLAFTTETSTVQLYDDLQTPEGALAPVAQTRFNSAVHIRIYKKAATAHFLQKPL